MNIKPNLYNPVDTLLRNKEDSSKKREKFNVYSSKISKGDTTYASISTALLKKLPFLHYWEFK